MRNFRYADETGTIIQADNDRKMPDGSTQTDVLNIPVDERNAHYRELVQPWLDQGNTIAPYANGGGRLAQAKRKRRAELREELLDRLVTSNQPADTLRAAARPVAQAIQAATTVQEVAAIDVTNW